MSKGPKRRLGSFLASAMRDLVTLGGAAAISYGFWLMAKPAGIIIGGFFALAAGLAASRAAEIRDRGAATPDKGAG